MPDSRGLEPHEQHLTQQMLAGEAVWTEGYNA